MAALSGNGYVGISVYDSCGQNVSSRKNMRKSNTFDADINNKNAKSSNNPPVKINRNAEVCSDSGDVVGTKSITNVSSERASKRHVKSRSFDAKNVISTGDEDSTNHKSVNINSINDKLECKISPLFSLNKRKPFIDKNDEITSQSKVNVEYLSDNKDKSIKLRSKTESEPTRQSESLFTNRSSVRKLTESKSVDVKGDGITSNRKSRSLKDEDFKDNSGSITSTTELLSNHTKKPWQAVKRSSFPSSQSKISNGKKSIVSMFETIAAEETINKKRGEFVRRKSSVQYYQELDELVHEKNLGKPICKKVQNQKTDNLPSTNSPPNKPRRKCSLFSYLTKANATHINDDTMLANQSINSVKSRPNSVYFTKGIDFQSIVEEKKECTVLGDLLKMKSSEEKHMQKQLPNVPNDLNVDKDGIHKHESKTSDVNANEEQNCNEVFTNPHELKIKLKDSSDSQLSVKNQVSACDSLHLPDSTTAKSPNSSDSESRQRHIISNRKKSHENTKRTSKHEHQFSGQRKSLVNMFENIAAEESLNKKRGELIRKKSSAQYYKEINDLVEIKDNENVKRTSLLILNNVGVENIDRKASFSSVTEKPQTQQDVGNNCSSGKTFLIGSKFTSDNKKIESGESQKPEVEDDIPSLSEEAKKLGELLESEADLYSALEKDLHRINADISTVKSDINVLSTEVHRKASGDSNNVFVNRNQESFTGNKKHARSQQVIETSSSASDYERHVKTYLNDSENNDTDICRKNSHEIKGRCKPTLNQNGKSVSSTSVPKGGHGIKSYIDMYKEDMSTVANVIKDNEIKVDSNVTCFPKQNDTGSNYDPINEHSNIKKMKLSRKKAIISMPSPIIASFTATDNIMENVNNINKEVFVDHNTLIINNNNKNLNFDEGRIQSESQPCSSDNDSFFSSSASDSSSISYSSYSDSSENITSAEQRKPSVINKCDAAHLQQRSEGESEELFRLVQNKLQSSNLCNVPDNNVQTYSSDTSSDQSDNEVERKQSVIFKPIEQINRKITLTNDDSIIPDRKITLTPDNLEFLQYETTKCINTAANKIIDKPLNEGSDKSWINDWVQGKSFHGDMNQSHVGKLILCLDDLRRKRTYTCDEAMLENSDCESPMRQRYTSVNQLEMYEDLRSEGMEVVADKETRDIISDTLSTFKENGFNKNAPFREKLGLCKKSLTNYRDSVILSSEYDTDSDSNSTVIDLDEGCKTLDLNVKKDSFNNESM